MITPTRFEVACVAWDCDPDRYPGAPVLTKPLVVDARSVREASKLARAAGWRLATGSKRDWWCLRHASMATNTHRNRHSQPIGHDLDRSPVDTLRHDN